MPSKEQLQLKLQSLGALRPEAWAMICLEMGSVTLKPNQSFIRKVGTLAFVAQGLLKEYDAQHRSKPALINFLGANDALITRKQNQNHYLKACTECRIYYWDFDTLEMLYKAFRELKIIYDSLCAEYDECFTFRQFLLEQKSAKERTLLFMERYHGQLPYLQKKDISNYLSLNYDHFTLIYQELLRGK